MLRLLVLMVVVGSCAVTYAQDSSISDLKARIAVLVADTTPTGTSDLDFSDRILQKMEQQKTDLAESSVALAKVEESKPPHMTAVLWDSGCIHGENWERDALPALREEGWRVDVRRVPPGHVPCPSFVLNEVHWTGYPSRKAHFDKIKSILHSEAQDDIVVDTGQTVVQQVQPVQRSVPPARRAWNYYGSGSLADHLRNTHGIDPTGMSVQDMRNAHSHSHEGTWSSVMGANIQYTQRPVQYGQRPVRRMFSGGCPGGMCP